jgi:hypothetical protein
MGKKIFVSYKYADRQVQALSYHNTTTVRNYVDILESKIDKSDHIYKGENDGEDLSSLADSTIGSKLGDKIFDSTVTIVFISKGMKENWKSEKDQWIPWEVSYSLKEQSQQGQNSKTNAVLAVVLPDQNKSYEYFINKNACQNCNYRSLDTNFLFEILQENMFNIKSPEFSNCKYCGARVYTGYPSFIYSVKWDDFLQDINRYIDIALKIRASITDYEIRKSV